MSTPVEELDKLIHRLMEQEIYDLDLVDATSFFEFCKIQCIAREYTKYDLLMDLMKISERLKNEKS